MDDQVVQDGGHRGLEIFNLFIENRLMSFVNDTFKGALKRTTMNKNDIDFKTLMHPQQH